MGVVRTAPWWLTWALAGSLVLLFLGERVFGAFGAASVLFSLLGALGVLACTVLRAISWKNAAEESKGVERILFVGTLGCLVALGIWFLSSPAGMDLFGIGFPTAAAESSYRVVLQIAWTLLLASSLLSLLGAQFALGAHRHARGAVAGVEGSRIREAASAGLGVALLAAVLFVGGYIASSKDKILDLSYFRTSVPGTSTEAMVSGLFVPLEIKLFFPASSQVKEEVRRYFSRLSESTGNVTIEEFDRLVSRAQADEYSVTEDGTVVLVVGDKGERIVLDTDIRRARTELRSFDLGVQRALLGLIRTNRTVFMTVGHGELNAPTSSLGASVDGATSGAFGGGEMDSSEDGLPEWMRTEDPMGSAGIFSEILGLLNYDVNEIGIQTGLANEIPETAAMVAILGPRTPFHPEEMAALLRYIDGGGSVLLALEPRSTFDPTPLLEKLGLRFVPTPIVNDVPGQFVVNRSELSDRQLILTNQFYSHDATTTVLQTQDNVGMLFVEAGYLEEDPDATGVESRIIVEAITSSFADLNSNFTYDEGVETRFRYALAIGVEEDTLVAASTEQTDNLAGGANGGSDSGTNPAAAGEGEAPDVTTADSPDGEGNPVESAPASPKGWRALVFSDSEIFSDAVLYNLVQNRAILADGARWLGRDEDLAGTTESEADVRIVHTQAEQVAWFYTIIAGAPFLVLAGGLLGVMVRRRSRGGV